MSGYKHATVTITEEEYRRLHDVDMQARFSEVFLGQKEKELGEFKALKTSFAVFEERQREYQEYVSDLEDGIRQAEIDISQGLIDQQAELLEELSGQINNLREDSDAALELITARFSAQIDATQKRNTHRLEEMNQQVGFLVNDHHQKRESAENWLNSTILIRKFIESHYDHDRDLPGRFTRIDRQIQQARENLENNLPEASLMLAQQVYADCSQARLELEQAARDWEVAYYTAEQKVNETLDLLRASRSIPALDLKGQELPIQIDLAYWSNGRSSDLLHTLRVMNAKLKSNPEKMMCEDLKYLAQVEIPKVIEEFQQIIYEVRLSVIYSQIRINIADIAIQALEKQGFIVHEYGFVEQDMCNPYFIRMRNIEGSQVILHVNPMQNLEPANDLVIESHDSVQRTESELRSRSQEILQSLTHYGLQVGSINTRPSQQDQEPGLVSSPLTSQKINKPQKQVQSYDRAN